MREDVSVEYSLDVLATSPPCTDIYHEYEIKRRGIYLHLIVSIPNMIQVDQAER